jgi:hypothetical protein
MNSESWKGEHLIRNVPPANYSGIKVKGRKVPRRQCAEPECSTLIPVKGPHKFCAYCSRRRREA